MPDGKDIQFLERTFQEAFLEASDLKRPIFLEVFAT
jgi:hypothetical protein